ncbi:hypothetical protein UFOVP235_49 [uncultured Caudovirales phage]|uniref:Uncharacterized protein n=1 Tax=uncultured Caudovirales phage TaxID=2100421 RepID=A0A6J7WQT2_9CAUD|nr:hypothetical protein UFOVP235_49 [uncultured Caudovirales phage]
MSDSPYTIDPLELARLLDEAAERGARRALESVGLHDPSAGTDIHDLRTLIESWRSAKRTALEAFVKWLTIGLLGFLATSFWLSHK